MSTSSKLFHPNELKKVIDAFYLKNKSNLDISGSDLLNYLRQNTQLTTKNLKDNQKMILKIAKNIRRQYAKKDHDHQKHLTPSTSSFAISDGGSPTFGIRRRSDSDEKIASHKKTTTSQSPKIIPQMSPKYTMLSPIAGNPNSPIDFNFMSKLSPDYKNDPYIPSLIGKKPPTSSSQPPKKRPTNPGPSLSPQKKEPLPRIILKKKKKDADPIQPPPQIGPFIEKIQSPQKIEEQAFLPSPPKKIHKARTPSPQPVRFDNDEDEEVKIAPLQREKTKNKRGRKSTYVLNCTDIDACKKKARDNNEKVDLERIKMLARSCDVPEDVIHSSKTRSKICDAIGERSIEGVTKKNENMVRKPPRQKSTLNCQNIDACKNKKMENGIYVGVDRIKKLAKEECGLSDLEIAKAKTRNKICDAIGHTHVEGYSSGLPPTTTVGGNNNIKEKKTKKKYVLNCSDTDACRNKKMENGEYVGIDRIKKLAKEECGLSDEEIVKAKTRNRICDAIEKSANPNRPRHEEDGKDGKDEKAKKAKKAKKVSKANNVQEINILDLNLLEKSAEELKQILIGAGQIKASHNLPINKKDIIEQYIEAPKCEPTKNKSCDEGKVCDMRSATKKNMTGFCVDPKFLAKSKATQYVVNDKKIFGPKKLIDAIKLVIDEDMSFSPSEESQPPSMFEVDKEQLEIIKGAFFNDDANPFIAYDAIRPYRESMLRDMVLNDENKKRDLMNAIKNYKVLGDRILIDEKHLLDLIRSFEILIGKIDERIQEDFVMKIYFSSFVKLDNELVMKIVKGENLQKSQQNMKDLLNKYVTRFLEGIAKENKICYYYLWNILVPGMRQSFMKHCQIYPSFRQEFQQAMEKWFDRYNRAPTDASEEDLQILDEEDVPSDAVIQFINEIIMNELTNFDLVETIDLIKYPRHIRGRNIHSFLTEMYFTLSNTSPNHPTKDVHNQEIQSTSGYQSQTSQSDQERSTKSTSSQIMMPLNIPFPDSASISNDNIQQRKLPRIPIKLGQSGKAELKKITLESLKQLPAKLQNIKQNANRTGSIANMQNKDYIHYIQRMGLVPISHREYEEESDDENGQGTSDDRLNFMFF